MLAFLAQASFAAVFVPWASWVAMFIANLIVPGLPNRPSFPRLWCTVGAWGTVLELILGQWGLAAGSAVSALVALAIWWWRRRKRKNVLASLGAKSRALRAKIVRTMRERTAPRRVLKPAPGGASA